MDDEWSRGVPTDGPTLAASLAGARVRGLALPADPLLHAGTGIARGFERFDPRSPSMAESARVDSALSWLRRPGRRFVWLELGDGDAASPWRRGERAEWTDSAACARRGAEVGRAIGRLERGLAERGERIAMVVVGTRGGAVLGDPAPADPYQVPLWIRAPRGARFRAGAEVSLLDVAPTLLDLAGVPTAGFEGRSLLAPGGPDAARPPRAPRASAGPCDAALRDWLDHPPARLDSAERIRARRLREQCPERPVHAIEEAVAVSAAGREAEAATLFQAARGRFAGDHRVSLAYADHLLRHARFGLVAAAVAGIPRESPLAAEAAWRVALAATAALDFPAARRAIAEAAALSVPARWSDAGASVARLAAAQAAVDREPASVDAKIAFGRALGDFGARDPAFAQLNQARMLDTTRVDADYWIAHYLRRDGRTTHAIRALERALARAPGDRRGRLALAEALASGDDWRLAIPHFERALDQDPSDGRAHYNLACLQARSGDAAAALAALERALDAGYADWDRIETDPDLETVRARPDFATLRDRHRATRGAGAAARPGAEAAGR